MVMETIPQLSQLTTSEKLLLVEELWDSIAAQPDEIPVPEWHLAELERRYQEYLKTPNEGSEWSDVQARLAKLFP